MTITETQHTLQPPQPLQPAPYNPDALRLIRDMARDGKASSDIACALGWSLARLQRISDANRLGLFFGALAATAPIGGTVGAAAAANAATLTWDARKRELRSERHVISLAPKMGQVFDALWRLRASNKGDALTQEALADRIGWHHRKAISSVIYVLRGRLVPFGLAIVSRSGSATGYRLVAVGEDVGAQGGSSV